MEPLEISDSNGMHDMSPEHMPPPSQRTPLNEEFAAGNECKPTWYGELEGGTCEAICVAVEDDDPTAGCNQVTACLCGLLLRAERVGNMPVLYARRRPGKPSQLICLVGPFWPCLMGVTYPLILGVSLFSAIFLLPDAPTWAVVLWAICTCTLVVALTLTACTNPGIVRRHRDEPPANTVSDIYASSDCILSLSLSFSLVSVSHAFPICSFVLWAYAIYSCASTKPNSPVGDGATRHKPTDRQEVVTTVIVVWSSKSLTIPVLGRERVSAKLICHIFPLLSRAYAFVSSLTSF